MVTFKKTIRQDYEILDSAGKCLGHIWKYAGAWVTRVRDGDAENRDTFAEAKKLAMEKCQTLELQN